MRVGSHALVQSLHGWACRNLSQYMWCLEDLDKINNKASLRNGLLSLPISLVLSVSSPFPHLSFFFSYFLPQSIWKMRFFYGFRDLWFVCAKFKYTF